MPNEGTCMLDIRLLGQNGRNLDSSLPGRPGMSSPVRGVIPSASGRGLHMVMLR